jgi:hypothetical protein
MLYRLFRNFVLVTLVSVTLLIGVSLVLGSTMPQDLQYLWSTPRQNRWQTIVDSAPYPINAALYSYFRANVDQWSTVGLYSTDRRLSATRQLPIKSIGAYWPSDDFAIVSGQRNGFSRTYQMTLDANGSRMHWLPTSVMQPVSPDGQWMLVYERNEAHQPIGLKAVPLEEFDQYPREEATEDQPRNWWGYVNWAQDGSYFIYGWGQGGYDYRANQLQAMETRLHDVATGEETLLSTADPNQGMMLNIMDEYQLRYEMKPQPLPARLMTDRNQRYNSVLYYYQTGEETLLSDAMIYSPNWSQDGRYLLYNEYEPTFAQRATQILFGSSSSSSPGGWSAWNVYYQHASHTLVPMSESSQFTYYSYYNGYPGMSMPYYGGYGMPYWLSSYAMTTYLFDTQTGETQLVGSREEYDGEYYAQWLANSNLISITASNPTRQYTIRPGEEPKLLQYEGENLVTGYYGLQTVASPVVETVSSNNVVGMMGPAFSTYPYITPPQPGQTFETPVYYYVDFEKDLVKPMEMAEGEFIGSVDFALNYSGINVSVLSTTIYNPAPNTPNPTAVPSTLATPAPGAPYFTAPAVTETNFYLLSEQGIMQVANRLQNAYVSSFPISPEEFVLQFVQYQQYSNIQDIHAVYFRQQDGVWQQHPISGNFTGLLGWRPKENVQASNDQIIQ